jgi:hypothetical protein
MAQQKIHLRKLRDFGENLGDTFQFIRQEFKPLLKSFALISGVFMLGVAIMSGVYQLQVFSVFDKIGRNPGNPGAIFASIFTGTYFLIIFLTILGMVSMKVVIASYMKLYDETSESPTLEDVWNEFKKYFLQSFILTILIWILVAIGMVFCLAPGIYLAVVFAPVVMIIVNENASIGEAFSRCFTIIKENFWQSLAIYLVAYIIYSFAAGIIGFVVGIIVGVSSYLSTNKIDTTMGLVTSIANIFGYFFYIVYFVSVGFNYYSLTERMDGFGMAKRIDALGTNANPHSNIEEEF